MGVRFDIQIDHGAVQRLLRSPAGPVGQAVERVVRETAATASAVAPAGDTGQLRTSFRTRMEYTGTHVRGWVYSELDYSLFVHQGTGVYGPRGTPIRPRRGRFLVFPSRRGGGNRHGLVFARQVRGQRPQPYLADALERSSPWPVDRTVFYG